MSINVYWTILEDEWMSAKKPESLAKNFYERRLHESHGLRSFQKCPFTVDHLLNRFCLFSLYDYSFKINTETKEVNSQLYDQDFFENHVVIRSAEQKLFSFTQKYVFFTEEKSLPASFPEFPYLENNNITQRCMPFVGTIDIGRYFRAIDFAFFLKEPYNEFIIEQDEIFGYVKFHTDKKINLKQFYPSDSFKSYAKDVKSVTSGKNGKFSSTDFFYNNFKLKNKIIKDIKNNLL
jgi:hypothetical protein